MTEEARLGSLAARESIARLGRTGADTVALIPFLWQASPSDPLVVRGSHMSDDELARGIDQARAAGLHVLVKPHVWVPNSWAGAVEMRDEDAWRLWFTNYATAVAGIARVAAAAGAHRFAVGTELARTSQRPEWRAVIGGIRGLFSGPLLYVAHNAAEAARVPFWPSLDAIGASLYPALGPDDAPGVWSAAMGAEVAALEVLAGRQARPVWVCEVGLRSAQGAAARPWESAEERAAAADELLQARVLAQWWRELDRPSVAATLIWRWLSSPDAGGRDDTDFTIQGKLAEGVMTALWRGL